MVGGDEMDAPDASRSASSRDLERDGHEGTHREPPSAAQVAKPSGAQNLVPHQGRAGSGAQNGPMVPPLPGDPPHNGGFASVAGNPLPWLARGEEPRDGEEGVLTCHLRSDHLRCVALLLEAGCGLTAMQKAKLEFALAHRAPSLVRFPLLLL